MQDREIRIGRLTHDALRGVLEADKNYSAGMAELWSETAEELRRTQRDRIDASTSDRHRASLTDGAVLKLMGGGGTQADMMTRPHFDIFGPPYADRWEHSEGQGTPHAVQRTWANAATGAIGFDYRIFPERGNINCGAAVWVKFMRRAPGFPPGQGPAGSAWIRTYMPYDYKWHDMSGMEAAHNEAGFGIYALSWNLSGGDRTLEVDHWYLAWDNTTDWNWNRANQSFPGADSDAFYHGQYPLPFPIRPARVYAAAIWCFGSGSAAGQLTASNASLTEATLAANVRFVIVEQQ